MKAPQLGLFQAEVVAPTTALARVPVVHPVVPDDDRALAEALPPWLRLGTSSWTFPGWKGLVYEGAPSQDTLAKGGLAAYAANPLFRTVGIDRSHYRPLLATDLAAYRAQLPAGFRAVSKVWDEITLAVFPNHARYGERAGQRNPSFLDASLARDVLSPYQEAFVEHAGPFVFELGPMPSLHLPDEEAFARRLDTFLGAVTIGASSSFRFAVELRNAELLTPRYLAVLRGHGVAHCLNFWSAMPTPGEQLRVPGVLTADFVVARLLQPPFTSYEARKAAFTPFDRIHGVEEGLRTDVVTLVTAAREAELQEVYILVGNKAEGSAPLTVRALARRLQGLGGDPERALSTRGFPSSALME